MDEKKRAEVHLVNSHVASSKTPGVKRGSNAYIDLDTQMMYDDGIEMYYSEETNVIFTRGVSTSPLNSSIKDVVEPKYFQSARTMQGEFFQCASYEALEPAKRADILSKSKEKGDSRWRDQR